MTSEDAHRLFWEAQRRKWQDAEDAHEVYRKRQNRRVWRRQRAVTMRDRASRARSAYIAVIATIAAYMLILFALARTCDRCSGHMNLVAAIGELSCLSCGGTVYLDRDPLEVTHDDWLKDRLASAHNTRLAMRAS